MLPCVLLVDDDQTTNYVNKALFTRMGLTERLLVALDGAEALEYLEAFCTPLTPTCPRLILLDVNMPGMNGVEFLEAYRKLPIAQQKDIVIVMLSTSLNPRDVERVEHLQLVTDFVSKPLTAAKVESLVRAHLPQYAA